MSESKRKSEAGDSNRKKKKYRSVRTAIFLLRSTFDVSIKDGTPVWGKRHVDGPGVWVSCASAYAVGGSLLTLLFIGIKGKEKQTVGEVCELFESVCRLCRLFHCLYLMGF